MIWTTVGGARVGATRCEQVTAEQLKGYASNLGTEYFTADTTGINNGFPILKWQLNRK